MRPLRRLGVAFDRARFHLIAPRRHAVRCTEHVDDLILTVPASVLNPVLFRTGPFLGRVVAESVRPGTTVLDLGCGSGVVGLLAARRGARVVAADINPDAVIAARDNAADNHLPVEARLGDLFDPIELDERFDAIAFNPPFFERTTPSATGLDRALFDEVGLPVFDRFLASARDHLAPGGRLFVAGSSHGALGRMRDAYEAHHWRHVATRWRERVAERLVVDELA